MAKAARAAEKQNKRVKSCEICFLSQTSRAVGYAIYQCEIFNYNPRLGAIVFLTNPNLQILMMTQESTSLVNECRAVKCSDCGKTTWMVSYSF